MFVTQLVLDEFRVPAIFYEVGGIGAPQRVQIQSARQLQVTAVAAEPTQQGAFGNECALLAGEQVDAVVHVGLAVGQPVADHFGRPIEDRQHAASFGWGSLLSLAIPDLNHAVAAELPTVGIAGEVDGLQVPYFVTP